ncbi:gamma-butyrobetaine hydroxylase-like domain-containing protein [Mangrovitalea sediminis]|uniref:gamma-butyrobetaine hydroxylase-like domain-containing protein n=1 Tax=Mangrovitalea sediminis TaxID=1982043 RepID=UPI000BE4F8C9|nr:DUF971 domain-containing protein [Mangrovitalea sediminis]
MTATHIPAHIHLRKKSRVLELVYSNGESVQLDFEYLRVFSPSAEVRGHGGGEGYLQTGKKDVTIEKLEPVGNYALKIHFSDGHDSGLYSWEFLRDLADNHERYWQRYLERLAEAGASRESPTPK